MSRYFKNKKDESLFPWVDFNDFDYIHCSKIKEVNTELLKSDPIYILIDWVEKYVWDLLNNKDNELLNNEIDKINKLILEKILLKKDIYNALKLEEYNSFKNFIYFILEMLPLSLSNKINLSLSINLSYLYWKLYDNSILSK